MSTNHISRKLEDEYMSNYFNPVLACLLTLTGGLAPAVKFAAMKSQEVQTVHGEMSTKPENEWQEG